MKLSATCHLLAGSALCLPALGQSTAVFTDIGSFIDGFGVPSPGFAAAAPIGGTWNGLNMDVVPIGATSYTSPPLVDTNGTTTPVTLSLEALTTELIYWNYDEPNTSGDDQRLLDDCAYTFAASKLTFDGFPTGNYDVIVYAMAPDDAFFQTSIMVVGSLDPLQIVGGTFAGGYELGTTHSLHTVSVTAGVPLVIEVDLVSGIDSIAGIQVYPSDAAGMLGANYCMANPNSTGSAAQMSASGSIDIASNDVTLNCADMPLSSFGFFFASRTQGFVVTPGGSEGNLCLSGAIGRYVGAGQIQNSGTTGSIELAIDLTAIPQPNGPVGAMPGETWNFQTWFRDTSSGGSATSNFSDGLQIDFQ